MGGRSQYDQPLLKGRFRLDLNLQYRPQTELVFKSRSFGEHIAFFDISEKAAEHGGADFFVSQADVLLRYRLTDRTELSLLLPYVRNEVEVQKRDEHHRNEVEAQKNDEHHRSETLAGLGDIQLLAKHFSASRRNPSGQASSD